MARDLSDMWDVERQVARDQDVLWDFVVGLRATDTVIQNGWRCWRESKDLLRRLSGSKQ